MHRGVAFPRRLECRSQLFPTELAQLPAQRPRLPRGTIGRVGSDGQVEHMRLRRGSKMVHGTLIGKITLPRKTPLPFYRTSPTDTNTRGKQTLSGFCSFLSFLLLCSCRNIQVGLIVLPGPGSWIDGAFVLTLLFVCWIRGV